MPAPNRTAGTALCPVHFQVSMAQNVTNVSEKPRKTVIEVTIPSR